MVKVELSGFLNPSQLFCVAQVEGNGKRKYSMLNSDKQFIFGRDGIVAPV